MSIRKRIFKTYLILIIVFLLYLGIYTVLGILRTSVDSDTILIYKSKNSFNEIFFYLNNIKTNWESGKPFVKFKEEIENHGKEVHNLKVEISSRWFYPRNIKNRVASLGDVWNILAVKLNWIVNRIESPNFSHIIRKIERELGVQQLDRLWIEMFYSGNAKEKEMAFMLNKVLDEIEYFPSLHGSEVNQLYDSIISEMHQFDLKIRQLQKFFSIVFFIIFIVVVFLFSLNFTRSLSQPIKNSINKLTRFMGDSIEKVVSKNNDELELLSDSVTRLISHYTKLSQDAKKLADGNIESNLVTISNSDVIGNALKEIKSYLKELANVSRWIKDGKYGAKIQVKSNKDILAQSFNIMSNIISEKIKNLRDIFDAVEEGIVVIDENLNFIEANDSFLKIVKANDLNELKAEEALTKIFNNDHNFIKRCFNKKNQNEYFTEIISLNQTHIPVKIIAKKMQQVDGHTDRFMLFVSNESLKMRFKREKEKLKAQAVLAELKALRAQINPHFLFNTINTIIYFAKTNPENAVRIAEKLADIFRYSLVATKMEMVAISEELDNLKKYIDIESTRFGDRFKVHYNIDPHLGEEQLPPMLLQPIIENAIKYGEDERGITTLDITVKRENSDVLFKISDHGKIKIKLECLLHGNGTGLKNVNQRLKTLYRKELKFQQNDPKGLTVSMKIPVKNR